MSERVRKVEALAREVLGDEIQGLKDPRVGFVTVTRVRVTPDLRQARVFISVLGTPGEIAATMAGLESARSHLRFELGRQIRTKYLPELTFELDTGPAEAERVEQLLHQIHEEHPEDETQEDENR
jgi:ribosome-binding factor A